MPIGFSLFFEFLYKHISNLPFASSGKSTDTHVFSVFLSSESQLDEFDSFTIHWSADLLFNEQNM